MMSLDEATKRLLEPEEHGDKERPSQEHTTKPAVNLECRRWRDGAYQAWMGHGGESWEFWNHIMEHSASQLQA